MNRQSVDPDEVAYYEKLGDLWWDENGLLWPLHKLNVLRTDYIVSSICQHFDRDTNSPDALNGLSILDIGCGGGILSESMAKLGASVTGIDVTDKNIQVAQRHSQSAGLNIHYQTITAEELAGSGKHFDVVLNMEVVEHVADLSSFMHACCQLVNENGIMFIATINRTPKAWLFAIIGAEYILRWLPKGTHQWKKFVTLTELQSLLEKHHYHINKTTGVKINPFTKRFSLCKSLAVNYMLLASRKR